MLSSTALTVRRLMTPDPVRLLPQQSVQEALELMNRHRIGAILVADETNRLVGIFTERDFLRRTVSAVPGWRDIPVGEWMSPQPYTIHPDAGWEEAVSSMERLRVRHLPVVEENKPVGIITTRQLVSQRADHLHQLVSERTKEVRNSNEALLSRDSELTHYMKAAAKLQKRLILPHTPPAWPEISWGVHYEPVDPLGGDFYDFALPDENHLGMLIADASGHSIPAAIVAIMTKLAFSDSAKNTCRPGEVLAAMNVRLLDLSDERFVTAFYGVLERETRRFTYASAGHPFPFRYSARTGQVESLSARGFLLGITPDEVYVEKELILDPGDRLCFFTDGVPDCRDEQGCTFGQEQIGVLFRELANAPANLICTRFIERLKDFRGATKLPDDLTFVTVGVT